MDDSGGAVSGGGSAAPASSSDHEYSSHGAAQPISIPKSNSASNLRSKSSEKIYNISSGMMSTPVHDRSRKSTLSKSAFEVTVNGLDVPEDHDHHHETRSRHRIEFDGYFVRAVHFRFFQALAFDLSFRTSCTGEKYCIRVVCDFYMPSPIHQVASSCFPSFLFFGAV
jgi:hypothetical protein